MTFISEPEFRARLYSKLSEAPNCDFVTGPGRSGAIAAVYASHFLGVPFVPYKCGIPNGRALIVDTAVQTGKTIRRASRVYCGAPFIFAYREPPRVRFWYEEASFVRGIGNEFPNSNMSRNLRGAA